MKKLMLGIFFSISLASPAHAEVMERKLSVPGICGEVLISFLLGYAAARFKTIFILSAVAVGGLLLSVVGTEMNVSIRGHMGVRS